MKNENETRVSMYDDEFERLFSDFIDGDEYDKADAAVFDLVRAAFKAGYLAASARSYRTENTSEQPER